MKITVTEQNESRSWSDESSGLDAITVEGNRLTLDGWYDSIAVWSAVIILTDEQRQALRDALG
jgi:hypothetical protein